MAIFLPKFLVAKRQSQFEIIFNFFFWLGGVWVTLPMHHQLAEFSRSVVHG